MIKTSKISRPTVPFVLAGVLTVLACAQAGTALGQPGSWPAITQPLAVDGDEPGCSDFRDVSSVLYATDATYLYFRMVMVSDAGWPGTSGASTEARYKIWFETAGTAATISGTTVSNAEYMAMVEDVVTNSNDPNGPRDQIGEMVLLDDLANGGFSARWATHDHYLTNAPDTTPSPSALWRRTLGTGTAGTGGPQQAMTSADIGYRISGANLDFYVSRASIGNPSNVCVIWASDTQSTNMDQAPNCDRPVASTCLTVVTPTPTPTASGTITPSATPTQTATATLTPTQTATNTPVDTATPTPTATNTAVDTATATPTATNTAEDTATATPTATNTAEDTATETPTATNTAEDTATETPTATNTAEDTATPTPTNTAESTATPTETGTVMVAETATFTGTSTPTPTPTATLATIQCEATPRSDCRTPRKSLLIVQNKSPDKRDIVKFKWRKGAATSIKDPAEFGDPVNTASYSLCIYHGGALLEELHVPAGGTCGSKPCWKPLRNHLKPPPPVLRAYKYRDKSRLNDGVLKVLLRGGVDGKASIVFKGSGPNLPDPLLGLNQPVVAQVINSETTVCWSDTYSGGMVKKNTAKKFKGKRK